MTRDKEILMQWLETEHRIKWQAKNDMGRQALTGEFMVLNTHRSPLVRKYVEDFCARVNFEMKANQGRQ